MLRLNKLTDYAVVILSQMALNPAVRFNATALAGGTSVPEPTVAKILKDLAKSDLVSSFRGASGGYQLTRSGRDITIRQVIEAIEGPIMMVECIDAQSHCCSSQKKCPLRGTWDPVNTAIINALDGITLADMHQQKSAALVNIAAIAE